MAKKILAPLTLSCLLIFIFTGPLHSIPPHALTVTFDGPAHLFEDGLGMTVDSAGNVYVTGVVYTNSMAVGDLWIAKYNPQLVFQTQRVISSESIGNGLYDQGRDIVVDGSGNVYVTGNVYTSSSESDIWVGKLDSSLVVLASTTITGPSSGYDEGLGITLDGTSVVVTGRVNSPSGYIPWVGRFNSSLVLQSSATITEPGTTTAQGEDVAIDDSGNVYVAGFRIAGSDRIRVWKFDNSLNFLSSAAVTVGTLSRGQAIVYGGGDLYVGGFSFQSGTNRSWVGRFDTALNLISSHSYNTGDTNRYSCNGITYDNSTGRVYITGYVGESDPPQKSYVWVAEYSSALGFLSEATANGTFSGADNDVGQSVFVNSSGEVFVFGRLYTTNDPSGDTDAALILFSSLRSARSDLDAVRVYPNPYLPAQGHTTITFANLPADVKVKIYTVSGLKVAEVATDALGTASWNARNSSGENVASGLYFAFVESNGSKKTFKFAVQR